jgi:trimethylamine:corrinoid methyltransferase-like protein
MMARGRFEGVDLGPLVEGVYTTLEKVGVLCENVELAEALGAFGARVDLAKQRVWFPRELVKEFTESIAKEPHAAPPDTFTRPGRAGFGTQICQIYYDWGTGQRRNGNRQDQITATKLGDALHGAQGVGHSLVQTEVSGKMESLESGLVLAEYAEKPNPPFAWHEEQVDYLIEMGEIMGRPNWFSYGANCFAHPLRFDKVVADKFVRRVREGDRATFTAMPVAGMTTPVTLEGFVSVATAELVAVWIAGRALNPTCGLGASMWAATIDMASGEVSYSAFDAMSYGIACHEFIRRWIGINITVGGGGYCASREPGMAAALEKAHKAMTIAAFTGQHPSIGQGMLECGRTLCPVQLLVERDLADGIAHLGSPIEPSTETVGAEWIEMVQQGLECNHMTTPHTLDHFRSLWLPTYVDRRGWNGARSDREMLDRAQGKVTELLAEYRKPEGREDQLAKMREVVERARKKLVG